MGVNSSDTLNLFLIIGVITITGCMVFLTYFFIQALRSIQNLSEHLIDATQGLKDRVGLKAIAAIPAVLVALVGKLLKRGR